DRPILPRLVHSPALGELLGPPGSPSGQAGQVAVVDAEAGAEQDPGEPAVCHGTRIGKDPEPGDGVEDLGDLEQPGQADDVDGDPPRPQRIVDGADMGLAPYQDRELGPLGPGAGHYY